MHKLKLSTKAKTLEGLSKIIKSAQVLPLSRFTIAEYKNNPSKIINLVQGNFNKHIIVRSSSSNEDNFETSNAGGFESIANVNVIDSHAVKKAIEEVISSYGKNPHQDDEIFIQPMLDNVTMSGVVFSSDLDTLSPYYIINYDESGSTDSVTSGSSNDLKNFVCFKDNFDIENTKLQQVVQSTKECEEIFDNEFLDIEFAFSDNQLYIFQVRPIIVNNKENLSKINLSDSLRKLKNKIEKLNAPHPNLLGDRTIFGVMPDWNPAEIIGTRPKRLALSLYKELITDETWAYQRDNYGYRNLRSHPLLVSFLGVPFIDVRVSFNSFIPKKLDDNIAKKLANYYLNELENNTNHHDKVEFEIIHSCYYFGIEHKLNRLKNFDFSEEDINDIKASLIALTNSIIDTENGLYKQDLRKVELLKDKYEVITNSDITIIEKIYWLIKDVKRYGTLPFAGIARAAFIAVQILKSFVEEKILSEKEYDSFLNSLNTVSKNLSKDISNLEKKDFLNIYGHLRPGTYDILSPRYDEEYELYFGTSRSEENTEEMNTFIFSDTQKNKIEDLIEKNSLKTSFDDLIMMIKESIEGRESSKFIFTKSLSKILKYIEEFGNKFAIEKEELAYLDIQKIVNLYSTLDHRDVKDILDLDIAKNKEFYEYTKAIKLPGVILNSKDIFSFHLEQNQANFITLNKIKSALVIEDDISNNEVKGKVVCIKSADPGYDYIFSKNIGGLITCYGGANSHMAIRCAEMGIPAVIGCGESAFLKYTKAKNIEIDAANKQVKILS